MKHEGRSTFISYWKDIESIKNWVNQPVHQEAKELGIQKWNSYYHSMIA